jgi:hypothetical protein
MNAKSHYHGRLSGIAGDLDGRSRKSLALNLEDEAARWPQESLSFKGPTATGSKHLCGRARAV